MRFESYAQLLEDVVLYCALKDVDKGFYIDVGANDPTSHSVTKFFYDRGWHGINIEPLPDKCALLSEMRPRDINLCVGLGSERGKLEMFEDGMGSTFLQDFARNNDKRRQTLVLTLSEVYDKYPPERRSAFLQNRRGRLRAAGLGGRKGLAQIPPVGFCH